MNIGKNISALRREKNFTQEALSSALGVSVAAVSKWETGSAYPDIELLPKIAGIFDVSVDYLMGYGKESAGGGIDAHIQKALALLEAGKPGEADEYLSGAALRHPNNTKIKLALAGVKRSATFGGNKTREQKRLLQDAEKILLSLNEAHLSREEYDELHSLLGSVYMIDRKPDRAEAELEKIRPSKASANVFSAECALLSGRGDEAGLIRKIQAGLFSRMTDVFNMLGWYYSALYNGPRTLIAAQELKIRLLNAVAEGHESPFDHEYAASYECMASMHARLGEKEKALDSLEKAVDFAVRADRSESPTYTGLPAFCLLDESDLVFSPHSVKAFSMALKSAERKEYDLLRGDPRFEESLRRLRGAAEELLRNS